MFLVLNLIIFSVLGSFVWVMIDPNKLILSKHVNSTRKLLFNISIMFLIVWFLLIGIFYSVSSLFSAIKILFS